VTDVITVDNLADSSEGLTKAHLREIAINEGYAGVVVTLDGTEPRQDDERRTHDQIQKATDRFIAKVDELAKKKEQEILSF
jgi:ribosome recycling factor